MRDTMRLWCPDCLDYRWSTIRKNPLLPEVKYKVCMVCGCRTRML